MGVYVGLALVAGFLFGFATSKYLAGKEAKSARARQGRGGKKAFAGEALRLQAFRVGRIIRGDTVEVDSFGPVRLIGIETLDGELPQETYAVPGKNALAFAEKALLGQEVKIEYDPVNAARGNKDTRGARSLTSTPGTGRSSTRRWSGRDTRE